ncbi:family 1 carbohydrate esterase [Cryphonectria parasitica EP155]|uniref:Carboxylic ester hydrolase n=1 Tax=Cryphonectria parasitica (strain ATCC 38755 / EP155) TaxID=660469 RepID=A0A9P4Y0S2_CRYP1|nr:family 1 carbohydrate esterase [Cryphonectria parasitica EP155]KAF3764277.1 family 1 carbohydrate esterase [Cryphonectria parasitica EP155]
MVHLQSFFAAAAALVTTVQAASLQQVSNYGTDTSGAQMYIYVPDAVASKGSSSNVPIVVAIHYCTGTGAGYYSASPYAQLADQYGFIVIYPSSPYSGTCWDVSSVASETHGGAADTADIVQMVDYALSTYGADKTRVFVTGSSSGAMMTNLLAATYPDVFAAGTVYSGVPAGCFYTGTVDGWNSTCAEGDSIHTQEVWTEVAQAMYPGYTGTRPKMLIFHGSADTTLYPPNFNETIKQWTGVFDFSVDPVSTQVGTPSSVYTKTTYGNGSVVGIYGQGIGHTVPIMGDQDMAWFGIS